MFSKSTEYALRAVIYIAQHGSETRKTGLAQISEGINSPQCFTAKILQVLSKDNRIISSTRGPGGGFFVNTNQRQLPIRSILEVMDEYDKVDSCVLGLEECTESMPCPLHEQYKTIKDQLVNLFDNKTIQDMVSDSQLTGVFLNNKRENQP